VKTAVEKLDALLARFVREADVYIVDIPGAELVVDGVDPRTLLILDRPQADGGSGATRARIFVYQRNVERAAGSLAGIDDELFAALEREVTAVFLDKDPTEAADKSQLN
jgi:hypothetical protein